MGMEMYAVNGVVTDGLGDVILSGWLKGVIDFGGGPIDGGSGSLFLVKLTPSGAFAWSKTPSQKFVMAGGPLGDLYVASAVQGFDLGAGPLLTTNGMVIVKLLP